MKSFAHNYYFQNFQLVNQEIKTVIESIQLNMSQLNILIFFNNCKIRKKRYTTSSQNFRHGRSTFDQDILRRSSKHLCCREKRLRKDVTGNSLKKKLKQTSVY